YSHCRDELGVILEATINLGKRFARGEHKKRATLAPVPFLERAPVGIGTPSPPWGRGLFS
ncbi:MAG TPA: hypothetical protein VEO19_10415, partial [Terriglobia bacterium]|nr:hypothetical protein [Terriglobia bacterium]